MSTDAQTPNPERDAGTSTAGVSEMPKNSEDAGAETPAISTDRATYAERLYATWWCWPLPLIGAVLMAAQIHMGYEGVRGWLPYAIAVAVVIVLMLWLGRARVRLAGGELLVGAGDPAHLPVEFVGELEVIRKADKREALGPGLDPAAFVIHRAWVGPMLRVRLTDPDDPTPYWLISTRSPERLAEAIRTEQAARGN
ncbi:DUF3093 family protein [Tamaricihabitans halophyticus]|uniref:DUF3093 family protein n=2 Tax=Tamaricihabitans halophyticus TaxID=1262583 RepID=A0A4R2QYB9_9PSEU|nr:DUF3093 family protein [Tamaricihabitans halophyticus]